MIENPKRQVVWQAESTHPALAETVKEGLREVVDPELGLNIIELGLVLFVITLILNGLARLLVWRMEGGRRGGRL